MNALFVFIALTGGLDEDVSLDIRHGWKSGVMDVVMNGASIAGDWRALLPAQAALGLSGDDASRRTSGQALISWAATTSAVLGIRALVRRERPEAGDQGWFESSFPSGHAASYFAVAAVYARRYPKISLPLGLAGLLVGVSRVYLGEHHPSDVLAGAALGAGVGALTVALWPRQARQEE